jgi:uncharacterized membrane protein YhaH (DUF805 family)
MRTTRFRRKPNREIADDFSYAAHSSDAHLRGGTRKSEGPMERRRNVTSWLIVSLTISLAAFGAGLVAFGGVGAGHSDRAGLAFLAATFALGVVWLLIVIAALFVHRWRGLELLIGAPFALCWPAVLALFAHVMANPSIANGG